MFCILEAFFSDHIPTLRMRRLWWTVNGIVLLLIGVIFPVVYSFTIKYINIAELMYVATTTCVTMQVLLFTPTVTHIYHNQLETVLQNINNEFYYSKASVKFLIKTGRIKYDSVSLGTKWFIFLIIMFIPLASTSYIHATLFCDENCIRDSQFYLIVIPYLNIINTLTLYHLIQGISLLLALFLFFAGSSIMLFYTMIGCELHNSLLNFCAHFHILINDTNMYLEVVKTKNKIMINNVYDKAINESEEFSKFKKKFGNIMKHYMNLIRLVSNVLQISF